MKKQLFTLLMGLSASAVFAQTIPNGNFENWQTYTYENPQYFMCANQENTDKGNPAPTVTKTADAYHGSYALKMVSTLNGTDTLQAWFANGNPGQNFSGGIPYTQMPTGLRFYYKNSPAAGDSAIVLIIFKKNGNPIGFYPYVIGGAHPSYTLFNKTFSPALSQTPDSVIFACASSNLMSHKAIPGSMLQVDSISFAGASQPAYFNGDLELWSNSSSYHCMGWYGPAIQTTDKYKGTYALELITNPPGFGDNQIRVGWLSNGKPQNNGPVSGGSPYSTQTDTLVFYYKYLPANFPNYTDSAEVNMAFFKNGSWVDGRGTRLGPSISSFKKVEIPFTLSQVPDTVLFNANSSKWPSQLSYVGSDLIIDQFYFKSQMVPVSSFTLPASGCRGVPIQLTDNSANMPTSWQWITTGSTPSNSSTQQNPVVTYTNTGTFNVSLQASDSFGSGAYVTHTIIIYNNPIVTASSATICAGTPATLLAGGANTYTWSNSSVGATMTVTPTSTTMFTVTGTSTQGCSNIATAMVVVPVPDSPDICMVSADSASINNVIYWDKTLYNNVDSFIVYREVSTGIYRRIGAQPYSALSAFTDTARHVTPANGDPNIGSYRYKLQIRDTCGNYGPLGKYHNTIYITTNNAGAYNWNSYLVEGSVQTPVSTFDLLRDDNNTGAWHAIGFVSGNQFSLNDPSFASYPNANWRVDANGFNCTPTMRYSNNNTQGAVVKSKSNITNNRISGISTNKVVVGVYPNPTSGVITLSLAVSGAQVNVYDITGNKVSAYFLQNSVSQIDISSLSNGTYFLEINTSKGVYHEKITKSN